MLIWIEVNPSSNENISLYYKKIGFNMTSPTKHNIQHLFLGSVLTLINNTESYNHIMECHEPITKWNPIIRNITKIKAIVTCVAVHLVLWFAYKEKSPIMLEKSTQKMMYPKFAEPNYV